MLGGGIYPGMITATIGTGMLLAVVATSVVIVRRRLRYEWWYTVHLLAYGGIALSWFHEIPTGNELVLEPGRGRLLARPLPRHDRGARGLEGARADWPARCATGLRVAEVTLEGPGVVSLRITGRNLDRLRAHAGQFFLWRFLARAIVGHGAPVLALGRARRRIAAHHRQGARRPHGAHRGRSSPARACSPRARSASSPNDRRRGDKAVLIAGGIGITPIRALIETMTGDVIVLYRVVNDEDVIFRARARRALSRRAARSCTTSSATTTATGRDLLGARASARARARHHRTRRLPLRPARDGRLHPQERPRGTRAAPPGARRALRPHLTRRPCAQDH